MAKREGAKKLMARPFKEGVKGPAIKAAIKLEGGGVGRLGVRP